MRSLNLTVSLALLILSAPSLRAADDAPPSPRREFRGVWVATVGNIDWPSRPGLSTREQQAELIAILDRAAELRLNAVIFQVRPMADALYASKLEPWSEYLTGKLGQAPDPAYDPLEVAVREAHARGLELHAWFNPYRARHPSATSPAPADHLTKSRPDLAKPYGKHYWLNPTNKDVPDHVLKVILDVVLRFDVDGVHIDDYFYPYVEKDDEGRPIPFPDDDTWADYKKGGGTLSRDDWRRDAVNRFVERMYRDVKGAKPWVKVGISPFGIWRPGNPPGIAGLDQYAELYADARRWVNEGWADYFSPQLYWPVAQEKQSYPKLLGWWAGENKKSRHLWPGNYTSRVTGAAKGWPASEIVEQIKQTRAEKGAGGNVHFSMKALVKNTGKVADALKEVYAEAALVPATPWAKEKAPAKPALEWGKKDERRTLTIRPAGEGVRLYVVRHRTATGWALRLVPAAGEKPVTVTFEEAPMRVAVSAVGRAGDESDLVSVEK
jgi:uncharacterized lipoprotein YddW (UPF0748 family)